MPNSDSASSNPVLELRGLTWAPPSAVRDGEPFLIENFDLAVASGEWVTLTGASGTGKTSLLSLCAGLLSPYSGSVEVLGKSLGSMNDQAVSQLRNQSLGLVFQNFHLDDSRNTLDNILLPAYFSNGNWKKTSDRARELGKRVGLSDQLHKDVSVLSGGQRQRVVLCRALLHEPQLLLADEPTAALDEMTAEGVLSLLGEVVETGTSILCVTHNQRVIDRSQREVVMQHSGESRE